MGKKAIICVVGMSLTKMAAGKKTNGSFLQLQGLEGSDLPFEKSVAAVTEHGFSRMHMYIKHAHTSLTTAENLSKSASTIFASDHIGDHAHFRHGAFFRAFDQVASHTAVKGVVAALETTPEASQAL